MNAPSFDVCLITPGHIASTPRLVKEATALAAAGYRVHVVAGRHFPPADRFDAEICATARWSLTKVDWTAGPAVFVRKALRVAARRLLARRRSVSLHLAARVHHPEIFRFAAAAARLPARLFIGHCLAGLPAAAFAARRCRTRFGFDIEDFHDAETDASASGGIDALAATVLQSQLLPGCAMLTTASPFIGERVAASYGVRPFPVLNVFPLAEAPAAPADPGPITEDRPAHIYWFSQTVGPGRGLEAVVTILGRLRTPTELHLRGYPATGYAARLQRHATEAGLARPIRFHGSAPAAEMARLAAAADLGLSTEETQPLNRDVCLTNKIFVYLLAGIPQLLSRTTAQTAFAPELGGAALLADLNRPADTAIALDSFFADPARVAKARRTAWELARTRFCWDHEQERFLSLVRSQIGPPA